MSKFYLLYAGEQAFYYYDTAGGFVIEFEKGKRPTGAEPIGKVFNLSQARALFEDEIHRDSRNEGKFTRNGFRVIAGKKPNKMAI